MNYTSRMRIFHSSSPLEGWKDAVVLAFELAVMRKQRKVTTVS